MQAVSDQRATKLKGKCSQEIIDLVLLGIDIPFKMWSETRYPRSKNIFCKLKCLACNKESRMDTKHLSKRSMVLNEICASCAMSEVVKNPEWIALNSASQKLIQSTPDQKKKNAEGVSRFWRDNPDKKEQVRQKLLEKYTDPEYKKMVFSKRGKGGFALSGEFLFRNKSWIEFGSSYELCFLIWAEYKVDITSIRKCKFSIPYFYEQKNRLYFPDFLIIKNKKKIIVENKSIFNHHFNSEKNEAKVSATLDLIHKMGYDDYWFIDELEASKLGLTLKRSSGIKMLCKILYNKNKLKLYSKKHMKQYIGVKNETEV